MEGTWQRRTSQGIVLPGCGAHTSFCQKGCSDESGRGKKMVVRTRKTWGQTPLPALSGSHVTFLSESVFSSKIWNDKSGGEDQRKKCMPCFECQLYSFRRCTCEVPQMIMGSIYFWKTVPFPSLRKVGHISAAGTSIWQGIQVCRDGQNDTQSLF